MAAQGLARVWPNRAPLPRKEGEDDAWNLTDYRFSYSAYWSTAFLALQPWMGLLPQWRSWLGPGDHRRVGAARSILIRGANRAAEREPQPAAPGGRVGTERPNQPIHMSTTGGLACQAESI